MPLRKGTIVGGYKVEKLLSDAGGMSTVYLASDREFKKRQVALKVIDSTQENAAAFQDLLRRETEILSDLRHPGIVRIYPQQISGRTKYAARARELGNMTWYYAMEHVQAGSLDGHMKQVRKLPLSWGVELFYQILITVEFLHKRGYAHSDLKPQNILLRQDPSSRQMPLPVLIDFGSAQRRDEMGRVSGSVRYSPPEVMLALQRSDLRGAIRPTKVDVWALGALFFEILTGRPLIQATDRVEATSVVLRNELDSIRDVRRDVDESIDRFLTVMLRRDPSRRPPVSKLITALETRMNSTRPPRI